uniref:Uncharacterized protein n=1 Tax=Oryza brachyantha TaxID=4533 RepID=J3N2I9_ORYBR
MAAASSPPRTQILKLHTPPSSSSSCSCSGAAAAGIERQGEFVAEMGECRGGGGGLGDGLIKLFGKTIPVAPEPKVSVWQLLLLLRVCLIGSDLIELWLGCLNSVCLL